MSEPEFNEALGVCMANIAEAQTALWAFDFTRVFSLSNACIETLARFDSQIKTSVRQFALLKRKTRGEKPAARRLRLGEQLRAEKVDVDMLVGDAVGRIAKRYKDYVADVRRIAGEGLVQASEHNGFNYTIFEIGTSRFELRAYRREPVLPRPEFEGTLESLLKAHQIDESPNVVKLKESFGERQELPFSARYRVFLARSTVEVALYSEGIVAAEVLAPDLASSEAIANSILDAL